MRKRIWLLTTVLLALGLTPGRSQSPEQAQLQGVWKLVSYHSSIKENKPWTGLMFLGQEYFSRVYMESDRARLDFNFETESHLTEEQKSKVIESFKKFRAGVGTYRVSGSTIVMQSTAIYNPSALGNQFSRNFRFEGKRLILTGVTRVAGDQVEEVWEPAE